MAKSTYEYVKCFESNDQILLNTWIVVRIDGKNFSKFSDSHKFKKPNDKRSLDLMNKAAVCVMQEFNDIIMAYGQSDEFSFIFDRETKLYKRRSSKLLSYVCSLFTSSFVFYWKDFFPDIQLIYPPSFDGRVVLYPTNKNLRDYLNWRQTDCHINNLYNTPFWMLVQKEGLSPKDAEEMLKYTKSAEKNELLFSKFMINYNDEPQQFRKGTFILKEKLYKNPVSVDYITSNGMCIIHSSIIKLLKQNPEILGDDQ